MKPCDVLDFEFSVELGKGSPLGRAFNSDSIVAYKKVGDTYYLLIKARLATDKYIPYCVCKHVQLAKEISLGEFIDVFYNKQTHKKYKNDKLFDKAIAKAAAEAL